MVHLVCKDVHQFEQDMIEAGYEVPKKRKRMRCEKGMMMLLLMLLL